jgi:hypothetical protein
MKLHGLRRLLFALIPVVLAAAMLGFTAGPASALPKRCDAIISAVYYYWGLADIQAAEAQEASAAGDYIAAAYYNTLAAQNNAQGDALYDRAIGMGCA